MLFRSQLRALFQIALASVFSAHTNFWQDNELVVSPDMRRRIKTFPIFDPHVRNLSSAGNSAAPILFEKMVEHLNKGRSAHRLVKRELH